MSTLCIYLLFQLEMANKFIHIISTSDLFCVRACMLMGLQRFFSFMLYISSLFFAWRLMSGAKAMYNYVVVVGNVGFVIDGGSRQHQRIPLK